MNERELIEIPGARCELEIERDGDGRLRAMRMAGREYLRVEDDLITYDDGFVVASEVHAASGLLRHVRAHGTSWVESYLHDDRGLPTLIDGVEIERDERGRITACNGRDGSWRYRYNGADLVEIVTPRGARAITRDELGRPVAVGYAGVYSTIEYRDDRRAGVAPLPDRWHTDDAGRLWCVTRGDGSIESIYLWDHFHCLARIDGEPGSPLAAVFSLDGTGTPVRIITRERVARIERDAFGESLLEHARVPGLFGGAQHAGFVHYRARSADPALGSFNAPDPWHGGEDDPRRAGGYRGTLIVERPVAGPYAVCAYDPIAFTDPTGTIAWYYLLSTLTWAMPNNLLTWVGIELTINFWFSLFGGEIDRYFTGAHLHSERFDIGAFQLDGFFGVSGQVFTTQHIVWAPREEFENHGVLSGFVPGAPIKPTYYGTFLRVVPAASPLVLALGGDNVGLGGDSGQFMWARGGGPAEAFAPGLLSPIFPSGGFHIQILSDVDPGFPTINILCPMDAVMTEVEPGNTFTTGTLDNRLAITVAQTGLGIADGALVLLTNASNAADIVTVLSSEESGSSTLLRLATQSLTAGIVALRLRGLGAMQSSETLTPGADTTHLNVTSTSAPYQVNDAIRMLDGTAVAGSAIVTGLEAQLAIDAALDNAMRPPMTIFTIVPNGPVRGAELTADATVLNFPSDPVPAQGDLITVTRASTTIAVAITSNGPGRTRSVDRTLSGLGAAGAVSWQAQARGADLGARGGGVEGSAQVTYAPITRGTAPGSGFIGVEDSAGKLAARAVSGVNHDVIVLGTVLPSTAPSLTVERYIPATPDVSGLVAITQLLLVLDQNVTLDGVAMRLLQLGSATLAPAVGTSVATGLSIAGATASQFFTAVSGTTFNVSDPVVLRNGSSDEIAIVKRIEMTLQIDRDLTLDSSGLKLVNLTVSGPRYDAVQLSARAIVVMPTVSAGTIRVQMPRFFPGEIVRLLGPGALSRFFRVADVAGSRLTLEGDLDIPAGSTSLTIEKMLPTNPGTGGPYSAIEGVPVSLAADGSTRWVKFSFWTNRAIAGLGTVGIISGGKTLPAVAAATFYNATQPDAAGNPQRLDVSATVGTPPVNVVQPRFAVGDNVLVSASPTLATSQFIVTAVNGTQIDVAPISGGTAISGAITNITVQRLPAIDVTFTKNPAATGSAVELRLLSVANAAIIPAFTQESGNAVSFTMGGANLTSPSTNLVVVIPFHDTTVTTSGELTSGVVKAPDDPENWEYDRRAAVAEHELRHTQQYNWLGPIWFAAFPMWILDTVLAATTDIELPAFSAFVGATLARDSANNTNTITIANMGDIPFAKGDTVQIYKGSSHNEVALGDRTGNAFVLSGTISIDAGEVFVRRRASGQGVFSDVMLGILRFGAPGNVMNLAMTLTWGTAFQFFGRIGYLISRLINHGTLLDANVLNSGTTATLADASQRNVLQNEQRVIVRMENIQVHRTVTGEIQDGRITLGAPLALSSDREVTLDRENSNRPVDAWFKATIEGGGASLRLKETSQAAQLSGVTDITIRVSGDTTLVRSIQTPIAADGTITFNAALPVESGTVKVAPYDTHTPGTYWHWNNYYPATVSPDKLATVTLQPVGNDHLTLLPRDRVRVLYDENDSFGFTTTVTAVNGDQVDLEQAMPTLPNNVGEIIVRLSKIGRDDPTGWLDQRLVDDLYDAGWVRWITDPFGQIHYTVQQRARGSFWDYFTRVGRYLLGSSAWSFLPAFGWLMWDRVFEAGYLARIEQDASVHSGDLYTSIGRLRGLPKKSGESDAQSDDEENPVMVVGDIAQYWFWPANRFLVLPGRNGSPQVQDAPGVNLPNQPVAMPFVTAESGPAAPGNGNEPNNNAAAGAFVAGTTESGSALADPFFIKKTSDPRDLATPSGSAAFAADVSVRGWVPMEPDIQRTMANYVAFSQPTTGTDRHRMTVRSGMATPSQDRHAQDAGRQRMFYNIQVDDVAVTINGVTLAEGAAVTLLETQRARVAVTPNNDRRYRATVTNPTDDPSLRQPEDLMLQALTTVTSANQPVEISRFYHFDAASGHYDSGALRGRGVYLPTDIDVAVRQLNVGVTATIPLSATLPAAPDFTIYNAPATPVTVNVGSEVFLLIAANVMVPGPMTISYVPAAPSGTIDPVPAPTDASSRATQALRAFLGDGRPFSIALAADDPPEQQASVQVSVTIGDPSNTTTLNVAVPITGHFVANASGAFQVARGATLALTCLDLNGASITPLDTVAVTLTDGTPPPLVNGADPELTFSVAGNQLTITANANATTGRRRLLITDSASATNKARRTIEIV
jgi:hypothetical protein